ncbi:DUF3192 domain-containing protein [Simiduia curdlanivorans]|uniref:DUF3192 domain-containing protein n=1 Tax=Simiduia curdlanivorans TaxID=1492769 RepID=A0ABV8V5K9_9GAMM|nr:DUF3192 domain-containing protein [Simiduia curdlanivorans]MDN3640269.1 DUF3192 domain-containing protein [Simiduia curdlanivorans]
MKLTSLLLATVTASLLSACIYINKGGDSNSDWEKTERENKAVISSLQINTAEMDIRSRLGEPDFSEGYTDNDADVRVLFYRTQRQKEDGITSKNECTPLVFRNGKLIGWGDKAYSSHQNH